MHADAQAAVQVSCYVVVPLVPRQSVARAALAWARRSRLPTASLERPVQAHRRAVREQLAHTDALRSELEAEGMATELLDGEQVLRLLWARLNPTKADHAAPPARHGGGGAGRARRARGSRPRPPGGAPVARAARAVKPRLQSLAPARGR